MFFCATNNMFPNMIVHLTFRAPGIVIKTHVDANVYLPCAYYKDRNISE